MSIEITQWKSKWKSEKHFFWSVLYSNIECSKKENGANMWRWKKKEGEETYPTMHKLHTAMPATVSTAHFTAQIDMLRPAGLSHVSKIWHYLNLSTSEKAY